MAPFSQRVLEGCEAGKASTVPYCTELMYGCTVKSLKTAMANLLGSISRSRVHLPQIGPTLWDRSNHTGTALALYEMMPV